MTGTCSSSFVFSAAGAPLAQLFRVLELVGRLFGAPAVLVEPAGDDVLLCLLAFELSRLSAVDAVAPDPSAAGPLALRGVTSMNIWFPLFMLEPDPEYARDMRGEDDAPIPSSLRSASAVASSCAAYAEMSKPSCSPAPVAEPRVERRIVCAMCEGECEALTGALDE